MKKILVLCTGNSARSQIAQGYLQYFAGDRAAVYSAGVDPKGVNPAAIQVMAEDGIDISHHTSNHADEYTGISFDYVITVCDNAREQCPHFPSAAELIHRSFPDPGQPGEDLVASFRRVRDEIKVYSREFTDQKISPMAFTIRLVEPSDWPIIREIYQQGIDTGEATYETRAPETDALSTRFLTEPRLVAESNGRVAGWAMLTAVSSRCVYGGVAETSIYIHSAYRQMGAGHQLLATLVPLSEQHGFWTLQAHVFPENNASIAVHEQAGFRQVGYRERLGKRDGIWRDVLLLERRSSIIGND